MRYSGRILQGLCFLGCLWLHTETLLAAPEIKVDLKAPRPLKVGMTCQLIVEVSWKSDEADYHFTAPAVISERLSVEGIGESNEVFQKGAEEWRRRVFRATLRATQRGNGKIRSFRLNYLDPENQLGGHFEVPPREVEIKPERSRFFGWLVISIGLTAILGLVIGGILSLRRNRGKDCPNEEPSLEDRCLNELKHVNEIQSDFEEDPQLISKAVRILRSYLIVKLSLPLTGGTGQELMEKIRTQVPAEEYRKLENIFETFEHLQFASQTKAPENARSLYNAISHYLEGKRVLPVSTIS